MASKTTAAPPPRAAPRSPSSATPPSGGRPRHASVPPPLPARRGRRTGPGWPVVAVLVVLLCVAGAGGAWLLLRDEGSLQDTAARTDVATASEGQPADDGTQAGSEGGASASTATPTPLTEQEAVAELEALRNASIARLMLDGRWIAQVAKRDVGTTDAVDILAESRAVTSKVAASSVLVLHSDDFGKRSYAGDGQPFWVTVVDLGSTSRDEVTAWCARTYPTLTSDQLEQACAPRKFTQPYG